MPMPVRDRARERARRGPSSRTPRRRSPGRAHSSSVTATASRPARWTSSAATAESTPPLIATSVRSRDRRAIAASARRRAERAVQRVRGQVGGVQLARREPAELLGDLARADARGVEQRLALDERDDRRARRGQRAAAGRRRSSPRRRGRPRRGPRRGSGPRKAAPPAAPSWAPGGTTPRPVGAARCSAKRSRSTSAESRAATRAVDRAAGEAGVVEARVELAVGLRSSADATRSRRRDALGVPCSAFASAVGARFVLVPSTFSHCLLQPAPLGRARRGARPRRGSRATESARRSMDGDPAALRPWTVGCDQRSSAIVELRADRVDADVR